MILRAAEIIINEAESIECLGYQVDNEKVSLGRSSVPNALMKLRMRSRRERRFSGRSRELMMLGRNQ